MSVHGLEYLKLYPLHIQTSEENVNLLKNLLFVEEQFIC